MNKEYLKYMISLVFVFYLLLCLFSFENVFEKKCVKSLFSISLAIATSKICFNRLLLLFSFPHSLLHSLHPFV